MKIPLLTTSRCQGSGRRACTQRQPRRPPTPGSFPPRGSPAMGAPRQRRRMLSANELFLNGQIPTDKALHAPTKAAAASSPPTPGRCSWACPRWCGRLAAWTNSEDLRRRLSHLRFLLHSLPEVKKKSTWLKGPKRK